MIVLLDNGHGAETPGKRSPDGRLLEWEYTRRVAAEIEARLLATGINAVRIVEERRDVPLRERCRRANELCRGVNADGALLVSIHCNAAGDGRQWLGARGWGAYVSLNASARSERLARLLVEGAELHGLKVRRYAPGQPWWRQDLAMCRDTVCPAVLTENLFMDNRDDVAFLLSEEGRQSIVDAHVKGITDYVKAVGRE